MLACWRVAIFIKDEGSTSIGTSDHHTNPIDGVCLCLLVRRRRLPGYDVYAMHTSCVVEVADAAVAATNDESRRIERSLVLSSAVAIHGSLMGTRQLDGNVGV